MVSIFKKKLEKTTITNELMYERIKEVEDTYPRVLNL
jgi:hypothetical protein